ncbi:MAG: SIS domain-containing protein [Methanobrevibacter sp.]|jgi:6-phospho-3-hexuloisomerase|nr:SIS domain-containing protein [Candidatus Methanovirga meridionalis]
MVFICTNCKHPLRTLGLSKSSYLKCSKCNLIIKKNEIDSAIDSNSIKYMKSNEYHEKYHLITVSIEKILDNLKYIAKHLDLSLINEFIKTILSSETIFITGSGKSKLICCAFCMRLVHLSLNSFIMDEITPHHISKKDCLIIISEHGESTIGSVNAKNAKDIGCKVLLLTSNPNSKIAKLSDIILNLRKIDLNNDYLEHNSYEENADYLELLHTSTIFEVLSSILLDGFIAELIVKLNKHEKDLKNKHFNLE